MSKTKELLDDIRDSERITIPQLIREYGHEVTEGNVNEFDAWIYLREIKKTLEDIIDQIQEKAVEEAEKYKGQVYKGYHVQVAELGGRYIYDHIPEYKQTKEQIKAIEEKAKDAFNAWKKGQTLVYDQTGEVLTIAKYKAGKTSITLKPVKA